MNYKGRYAVVFCVLIVFMVITLTCNRTSHLLPDKYKISIEDEFSTTTCYGRILKVAPSIELKEICDYPRSYKKNLISAEEKPLVLWTSLDSLEDRESIIADIRMTLDYGDNRQIKRLMSLIDDSNSDIYFSGLGEVMKGLNGENHNFYQFKYILDRKTNEIYELGDIH